MQTVWSRSIRPQNTRCIPCSTQIPSTLSRRTTTGIFRKQLNAGDAFTLLLGPVLGGAFVADAKAKDKRRRQWDEKIAAAQAEVEEMRRNEVKPYSSTRRNLRRLPALSRSYSSASAIRLTVTDEEDSIEAVDYSSTLGPDQQDLLSTPIAQSHDGGPGHEFSEGLNESNLVQKSIDKCKRLQRLVAIKLAIRMILHIHIGKSPRYICNSADYVYEPGHLPQNANELIRHLKRVRNSLRLMNSEDLRSSWRAYQILTRRDTCKLDQDICDLAGQLRRGEISVAQLVEQFAAKVLSSPESPTVRGYIPLLSALSQARFDELGFMIDGTMIEARLPYDRHAVFILLWQYGKNKESHYFDRLLKKLTTDSAKAQFGEQWEWRTINHTLIPVPPSRDPQILQILIYTALKCNQPHRAEAWSTMLGYARTGNMWLSHVIRNFLKYYSVHKNWHKGQTWMETALDQAEILAGQGVRHLQRIVFAMLDCCASHGKRSLYRDILRAAVQCRLGVYSADLGLALPQRSADILREWQSYHELVYNGETEALSSVQKARMFARKLGHIRKLGPEEKNASNRARPVDDKEEAGRGGNTRSSAEGLSELLVDVDTHPEEGSATSNSAHDEAEAAPWKELCRQQQTQLDSLRRQLEALRSGQDLDPASMGREHDKHPSRTEEKSTKVFQGIAFRAPDSQIFPKTEGELNITASMKVPSLAWRPISSTSRSKNIQNESNNISSLPLPSQKKEKNQLLSKNSPRDVTSKKAAAIFTVPKTLASLQKETEVSPAGPTRPKPTLRFHPPRAKRTGSQLQELRQQKLARSPDTQAPITPAPLSSESEEEEKKKIAPPHATHPEAPTAPSTPVPTQAGEEKTAPPITPTTLQPPSLLPPYRILRIQESGSRPEEAENMPTARRDGILRLDLGVEGRGEALL
ncbi:hypothetical protein EPUS_02773 [Endocarpon pusillum Z07020]|uniref:Uncharacterized protein n=1 Tax=Endocarpon pusillum (strain Z07020 / HMAS-L-300199) TaxID=1263415 RepID=U1FU61_ENDPU|nr:uncharacterized protein EPUS_02773 [Endocarpon pusillum Z07020]ERF68317.1 hypothetical protein EPUS_02773 [Endocarpon pusillum Z07020]